MRIDPGLWAELEAWAAAELRSVNGQVEYILKQAVQRRRREDGPVVGERPASAGRKGAEGEA
jgi:hypothetical protein